MKNAILIYSFAALVFTGCLRTKPSKEEINASYENISETSHLLANLPSTFQGTTGTAKFDSVVLILNLKTNTDYILNKEFYRKGEKDTFDNIGGKWVIEGQNMIHLLGDSRTKEFENFMIISHQELKLMDSLKKEILDDRNYFLVRRKNIIITD